MESDFNMQPVVSDNLVAVGFNESTNQGRVDFKRASYIYDGCTQDEADEIVNAPSANDAFNSLWKNSKPYRKV
jgi:hypothetical protein